MPATRGDVAAYLENRAEAGARASTLKVAVAAIAHNHKNAGTILSQGTRIPAIYMK